MVVVIPACFRNADKCELLCCAAQWLWQRTALKCSAVKIPLCMRVVFNISVTVVLLLSEENQTVLIGRCSPDQCLVYVTLINCSYYIQTNIEGILVYYSYILF